MELDIHTAQNKLRKPPRDCISEDEFLIDDRVFERMELRVGSNYGPPINQFKIVSGESNAENAVGKRSYLSLQPNFT